MTDTPKPEQKHTPGPWVLFPYASRNDSKSRDAKIAVDGDGTCVAVAYGYQTSEAESNARLIAAAPDMLEQLEYALKWFNKHESAHPFIATIGDVIAKAKGDE